MRIDLILESSESPERIAELSKLAEDNGLAGVWVSNTLSGRDPFLGFLAAAQATDRIHMGPIAVSPYELHPLKMATSLLSLNEASNGRARIVVGGGGVIATRAMNLRPERRVRGVRECIEIIKQAATGLEMQYEGELFTARGCKAAWVTKAPPVIYAGANKPQMLRMAARCADGVMLTDKIVEQIGGVREIIDPELKRAGRDRADFQLSNFWAWHVKKTRAEAETEARMNLTVRDVLSREKNSHFMSEADMRLVEKMRPSFLAALRNRSPVYEGVPERIIRSLVDNVTSCAGTDELDKEIARLQAFDSAGLTGIALRIYAKPEEAIRLLGKRVVPVFA